MSGFLDVLGRQTGRLMQLGLEPEPFGHFHDTDGAIRFFNGLRNRSRRPELIERHLGLTYDTCHFAILREEPDFTPPPGRKTTSPSAKCNSPTPWNADVRGGRPGTPPAV